jgi:hypothetical protein
MESRSQQGEVCSMASRTPFKVIVCGSRNWYDYDAIAEELEDRFFELADTIQGVLIIEGGAQGADSLAHAVAKRCGYAVKTVSANWDKNGKAAGPIRNREMLALKPDLVIAFRMDGDSPGTDNMIKQATQAHVPVRIVHSTGRREYR